MIAGREASAGEEAGAGLATRAISAAVEVQTGRKVDGADGSEQPEGAGAGIEKAGETILGKACWTATPTMWFPTYFLLLR